MTFAHMTAVADRIDRITSAFGRAVAWLALVVVLLQFALVVVRYLFGLGSVWLTETVVYAHAAVFMLAAAWTLQVGGHVRVDIFYADASDAHESADRSCWRDGSPAAVHDRADLVVGALCGALLVDP